MRLLPLAGVFSLLLQTAVADAATSLTDLLPQFPRAELVEVEESKSLSTHEVITGALRSRAGTTVPEDSRFVTGRRAASTWHIPDEQRTDVVYAYYREHLLARGESLFECAGFDCGSSNHWANNVFRRPILYGPPQNQRYLLVRIDADRSYFVALYVALRGTRKLYVHTEVIIGDDRVEEVSGATIVDALASTGRFVIAAGTESGYVDSIVAAMAIEPLMRIAVVGHDRRVRGESVEQTIARSRATADSFRQMLVTAGISSTRINSYGVGPLSPLDRKVIERLELVLISREEGR